MFHRGLELFLILALTDFFELMESGILGAGIESGVGSSDGASGDDFLDWVLAGGAFSDRICRHGAHHGKAFLAIGA